MNIEFLMAEADMAIERNQAMTSGKGKYRADHHAELVTVCTLLGEKLKELKSRVQRDTHKSEQEYAEAGAGIVRAPYRVRAAR